ncbi:MAG: hypothetical protein HY910_13615 [Desulfarculus sp.]|nr:hypothetical protein [Desulfarculus sp.]
MTSEEQARLTKAAVVVVLQASQEGRLTTREDVLQALVSGGIIRQAEDQGDSDDARRRLAGEEAFAALAGILAEHPSLASFQGLSGQTVYHCPDLLSRTYARILDRKSSPPVLMAEEIRANSRDYPRPVPVELFEASPFELPPEEIEHTLRSMAADPQYQDITFTTTASGAVYLFSALYLERGYAAFLAQRAESLAMNP